MQHWSNKNWGALIGALVVIFAGLVGVGLTALAILVAVIGYFIGKFLDGELSLQDIQDRAQGRMRSPQQGQSTPRPPRVD